MNLIAWDKCLSVDDDGVIDAEHKGLLNIVNRLADRTVRLERVTLEQTMNDLHQYTMDHFSHEEQMMRRIGWPEIDRHIHLHQTFRVAVEPWVERVASRWQPWHGGSLFVFVASWLINHIADEDRRIGVFARTGRVPPRVVRKPLKAVLAHTGKQWDARVR